MKDMDKDTEQISSTIKMERHDEPDSPLPVDVQEEIEDLYHYVPEVHQHFKILNKIGEGTFSSVFLARLRHHPEVQDLFALKHIIPTSHPYRILGELKCLQVIGGTENVMGMELCLRHKDHIVIVMKYFPHHRFQDYIVKFEVSDVQDYMRNLLVALRRVHQFDIIHRDIKPSNFLFNIISKQYSLVDFGLAHEAPVKLFEVNKNRPPIVMELPINKLHLGEKQKDSTKAKFKKSAFSVPESSNTEQHTENERAPKEEGLNKKSPTTFPAKFIEKSLERHVVLSPSKASVISPNRKVRMSPRRKPNKEAQLLPPPPPPLSLPPRKRGVNPELPPASSKSSLTCSLSPKRKMSTASLKNAATYGFSKHGQRVTLPDRAVRLQEEAGQNKNTIKSTDNLVLSKSRKHRPGTLALCQCFGRPVICSICLARAHQSAPRAGTPGFRAPEVLMKHPHQTTAVDIWSAGVIFLSLLSGRYPFFRASDDLVCLCQIISLLGTEEIHHAARGFGKVVTCRPVTRALDLKHLCTHLRSYPDHETENPGTRFPRQWREIPDAAVDLLKRLLDPNPHTRITAENALQHSFFLCTFS